MKTTIKSICSIFLLLVIITGCGKDNYDEPSARIYGYVTYNGKPICVKGTRDNGERVRLNLYQDGYEYNTPLEVFVGQDGSFSALMFDGVYRLTTRDNCGPWENADDSVEIIVKGDTQINYEVIPFFTISDADIKLTGNQMTAAFKVEQITDVPMNRILLLVGSTAFVDDEYRVQREDFTTNLQTGTVSYSMELNDEAKAASILYGRVAVFPEGKDHAIYSPVIKLK
ncbi:MAG: DUF3823 domain-containing protein [Tannerellaceae bacterium]|nr:DUF3823 domain-containing protein [Tannerellaceae bacterium]